MSACPSCGYRKPINPFLNILGVLNFSALMVFVEHMTPSEAPALGVQKFYVYWHSAMWWFSVAGIGLAVSMFFVGVLVLVMDQPPPNKRPS